MRLMFDQIQEGRTKGGATNPALAGQEGMELNAQERCGRFIPSVMEKMNST